MNKVDPKRVEAYGKTRPSIIISLTKAIAINKDYNAACLSISAQGERAHADIREIISTEYEEASTDEINARFDTLVALEKAAIEALCELSEMQKLVIKMAAELATNPR